MNVSIDEAGPKIAKVRAYAQAAGRNPAQLQFSISPGLGVSPSRDELKRAQDAGVQQIIVGSFPADLQAAKDDIARLAEHVVGPAASL